MDDALAVDEPEGLAEAAQQIQKGREGGEWGPRRCGGGIGRSRPAEGIGPGVGRRDGFGRGFPGGASDPGRLVSRRPRGRSSQDRTDVGPERGAGHQLHREPGDPVFHPFVHHPDDPGVLQPGQGVHLSSDPLKVISLELGERLDRQRLPAVVGDPVDDSHAALAKHLENAVPPDPPPLGIGIGQWSFGFTSWNQWPSGSRNVRHFSDPSVPAKSSPRPARSRRACSRSSV